jgi:sulfatase maturation enzyme AslB (radical SAM superfamily)
MGKMMFKERKSGKDFPSDASGKGFAGQISISKMCNLRHSFCFQNSFSTCRLSDDVLYNRLKPLYENLNSLRILGGEPTVIPGIKEWIDWLKTNYPMICLEIVTNGVELDRDWLKLIDKHNILVQVSVNGISDLVFNKIMLKGDPVRLKSKIFNNLENLIELDKKRDEPVLNCISMVVNEDSFCDLREFSKYAMRRGVNMSLQFPNDDRDDFTDIYKKIAYDILKYKYFCKDYLDVIAYSVPEFIYEDIAKDISEGKLEQGKEVFLHEIGVAVASRERQKAVMFCQPHNTKNHCQMPVKGIAIQSDGMVFPCCSALSYPLGNIYFDSAENLMDSHSRMALQEMINSNDYHYCWNRCIYNKNPKSSCDTDCLKYEIAPRTLFNDGKYAEAAQAFDMIKNTELYSAMDCYEHAYCLHVADIDMEKAIQLYSKSLEMGFNEFWVRYNRADAFLRIGALHKAEEDIEIAHKINPEHEGCRQLYRKLSLLGEN